MTGWWGPPAERSASGPRGNAAFTPAKAHEGKSELGRGRVQSSRTQMPQADFAQENTCLNVYRL